MVGLLSQIKMDIVSTHSRAEAAACALDLARQNAQFQHTAARRRLLPT